LRSPRVGQAQGRAPTCHFNIDKALACPEPVEGLKMAWLRKS
jgi:hypothetical protein